MLFRQKVKLVEPTKLLTRIPVDTMTFTNPLYHDYTSLGKPVLNYDLYYDANITFPKGNYQASAKLEYSGNYKSIEARSKFPIYAYFIYYKAFLPVLGELGASYVKAQTQIQIYVNKVLKFTKDIPSNAAEGSLIDEIDLEASSPTKVLYVGQIKYYQKDGLGNWTIVTDSIATAEITTSVVANTTPRKPRTLADVVDRVLAAGLGHQSRKYTLDEQSIARLEKYIAPEFKFTRNNLYEVLLQIGGYSDVQGIPRLKSGADGRLTIITYDFLSNEEWQPKDENGEDLKPIARTFESTIDDWCGGFETYAENLIDNSPNGSVRQPCLQTMRVETGELEIDDNHAIIPTPSPVYTVQSVEMGYIENGVMVGEINPYIFESAEYNNLTGYKGEYPFAKQFALCYTQGQRNITALTLKPQTATSLGYKLEDMSAIQIAERVSGRSVPKSMGLCKLAYRVTYTPIQTARLRQYRPYMDKHDTNNVMFYNQAGNSLDINNYGSNVKNNLIQTGNKVEFLTFRLTKLSQRPKIGQKYNGKYISSADYEYERYWIKVTITLTENYNRKSQYVVLDSRQRFYEISERNVENRLCNFSFEIQVGNEISGMGLLKYGDMDKVRTNLTPTSNLIGLDNNDKLIYVVAQPLNADGGELPPTTIHELSANAFGNSILLSFGYEDNYSAGNQAVYNASDRKLQRAVQYGDEYGEFDTLVMSFYAHKINTNFADQVSTETKQAFCDALPAMDKSRMGNNPPLEYRRRIMKDGGERIAVTTQFHFRVNRNNVVIGSALAKTFYLVVDKHPKVRAVLLKNELEKWQEQINMNDTDNVMDVSENSTYGALTLDSSSNNASIDFTINQGAYKACALVTADGEIIIGENGNYSVDSQPKTIFINARAKEI